MPVQFVSRRRNNLSKPFCCVLIIVFVVLYTWLAWQPWLLWEQDSTLVVTVELELNLTRQQDELQKRAVFEYHWCRMQRSRVDWEVVTSSCVGNTDWGLVPREWQKQAATDPLTSFISTWDVNPAGEFSRFFIQSQTADEKPKLIGGDAWRVHLSGPAYIAPDVIDHGNGSYEVLFLAMEPGTYNVDIVLDYTLCNGLRDPPSDWFIKGNAQGKGQRYPEVDKTRDYILAPLWNKTPVAVTIPRPSVTGFSAITPGTTQSSLANQAKCDVGCNLLWDGFGRWVNSQWEPYVSAVVPYRDPHLRQGRTSFYGDSVGDFFAQSLNHRKLCRGLFRDCIGNYNWIYPVVNFTVDKVKTDDLDFDRERVLNSVRAALRAKEMDNRSLFIINCGLHYVESVNFTSYQRLVDGLIRVFKETFLDSSSGERKVYEGRIIWKTTTAINKQRASNLHLGHRRFLTYQRVLLYNAYAMWAMCRAGVYVLDVYPISDSYPWGTGTHGSRIPAPNDVVHYSNLAFEAAENLLEAIYQS